MQQALVACAHCDALNRLPLQRLADTPRCGRCKQPVFSAAPIEVGGANFNRQVMRSDLPVLVDFWAPWCGPCRMMAPVFAAAARELEPRVRLVKLNTEAEPQLAGQYGIRSIPTLALFRGGREIARQAGAMAAPQLLAWVRQHLARAA